MAVMWKAYAWVLLVLFFLSIIGYVLAVNMSGVRLAWLGVLTWATWAITLMSVVGVFGFAFRRKLLNSGVWKLVFGASVFLGVYEYWELLAATTVGISWTELITWEVFLMPKYVALFLYGWRSPQLWEESIQKS